MKQSDIFGSAVWLGTDKDCAVLRGKFTVSNTEKATLYVLGLGFFHCYINGKLVSEDEFLPLSTDYEERENYPVGEKLTHHRIYVPTYDITHLLCEGENSIAIHFGAGWYSCSCKNSFFGSPKAIWRVSAVCADGTHEFYSSTSDRIGDSYVVAADLLTGETHDYTVSDPCVIFGKDFDDSSWQPAEPAAPLDTDYLFTDCPADRVIERLTPTLIKTTEDKKVYDIGYNCAVIPVIRIDAPRGEEIVLAFSEEKDENLLPDENFCFTQHLNIISDGTPRTVRPEFTWFAFRYFSIKGNATPISADRVSSDVKVTSTFNSDNDTLNWIYNTFIRTQLSNMHAGIPSDCPHIERRGYTGDGQLACHAVMNIFDAEKFYRKWIADISDCQDTISGHVQYTAPYIHSGGGPGGWGCAIVEVPYQFYKHYGDTTPLRETYDQMLKYFDFLESCSENGLVVTSRPGIWCLGDWLPPAPPIISTPFVNNYFYIKSMRRTIQIAKIIGREEDIPMLEERIEERKHAMVNAYFDKYNGNFFGGAHGANAFAVDIGIGDQRTYTSMVDMYTKNCSFNAGIFGTDILARVLFENGDGDLATKLLISEDEHSFARMKELGATSIWEIWPFSYRDRSHDHPMFGAVTAYLFDYILGITQPEDSAAYASLVIAPCVPQDLSFVEGSRVLPSGKVSVRWEKEQDKVRFTVTVPENVPSVFKYKDQEIVLSPGLNELIL